MEEQFSVGDGYSEGLTRATMRRMPAPFRGARDLSAPSAAANRYERAHADLVRRCRAYVPVAPVGFAFSHRTAAALYRLPLPRADEVLDVSVTGQPPRRAGVRGHRGLAGVRLLRGLPLVHPEIAWLQLAPLLTLDELVVAGDALVGRKLRLATLELLQATVVAASRMRGVAAARAALVDIRTGTDSPPESVLRLILVRAGLPEPLTRCTVFHEGAFVGTPDLAYPDQRIAIEYEGEHHRTDAATYEDDIYRREMFERAGWRVYLVTAERLRRPAAVVAQVRSLLAS